MHGDVGGGAMMLSMYLVWIAPLALIGWAAAAARSRREPRTPLELLKESYARGKVTREEFEQARKDLS
jgi:uncharacterized membrane protein